MPRGIKELHLTLTQKTGVRYPPRHPFNMRYYKERLDQSVWYHKTNGKSWWFCNAKFMHWIGADGMINRLNQPDTYRLEEITDEKELFLLLL